MGNTTLRMFLRDEVEAIKRFQKEARIEDNNRAAQLWISENAVQFREDWMEKNRTEKK